MKRLIFIITLTFITLAPANSQILISLIFGETLNSEKVEFGMDGGFNYSTLTGLGNSDFNRTFNLGFYFDLKHNEHWMLHTGVLVKSAMGVTGLDPYEVSDPELTEILEGSKVTKTINYFNVPICIKYRFAKLFHIEAGPMLGLRYDATDRFYIENFEGGELAYKRNVKDKIKPIDAGILLGTGMKLSKELKSMQAGVRYYYGLTDIIKDNQGSAVKNSSFYLFVSIPIGANPKDKDQ